MIECLVCGLFSNYNQSFPNWSHSGNTSLMLLLDLWQIIHSVLIQKCLFWIALIKNCFKEYTNICLIPRLSSTSYRREIKFIIPINPSMSVNLMPESEVICYYWEWTHILIMCSSHDHLILNFLQQTMVFYCETPVKMQIVLVEVMHRSKFTPK